MSEDSWWFDFGDGVEQMLERDALVRGEDELAVWGGEFPAEKLPEFLAAWDFAAMPYRLWEYAHRITFTEPEVTEHELLERGRVFGAGGDLNFRRDGPRFLWNFTGEAATRAPPGFTFQNFWREHPSSELRRHDATALLWGDYREEHARWHDDRVGWATLDYPCADAGARTRGGRLRVRHTIFSDGGQPAFVWWKELERYGEGHD